MSVDRWATVHQWQKLVKTGLAKPITADDGTPYIVRVGKDNEPRFWNPADDSFMDPGLYWWENLRDAVDRAELDALVNGVLQ